MSIRRWKSSAMIVWLLIAGVTLFPLRGGAQSLTLDRENGLYMLERVSSEIKKNYYDPSLRGVHWDELYRQTDQRIRQAQSAYEIAWTIYYFVRGLNDSHTIYLPPRLAEWYEYDFSAKFYGERLYVHRVGEGSAAEQAGLQVGDQILGLRIWGQAVRMSGSRELRAAEELLLLSVLHLIPPPEITVVIHRDGEKAPRELALAGKKKEELMIRDMRMHQNIWQAVREWENQKSIFRLGGLGRSRASTAEEGEKESMAESPTVPIGYLEMPNFGFDKAFATRLAKEIMNYDVLVIDLRGNPGGRVDALQQMVGFFEPTPVTIGEEVGRKETIPFEAKPQKPQSAGPLVILVDSETASAAEVFARHFQREQRAKVVGDQTAGKVVVARVYELRIGTKVYIDYGVQVSVAQLLFPDGENLEGRGVTPDYVVLPSGEDLREERDPMLAKAAEVAQQLLLTSKSN
jgi:C-terminal processing protease CtpA/Prc